VTATGAATDTRRALLGRLIDHAALFPPASMSLPDAVAEDRLARESPFAWMLARFVCPASKLEALRAELPWEKAPALSVVLDGAAAADGRAEGVREDAGRVAAGERDWLDAVRADATRVSASAAAGAPVNAVEVRLPEALPDPAVVLEARRALPWEAYFELVLGDGWRDGAPKVIGAVAAVGGRVKLRCGGESVPTLEQVALVIAACREAGCVFKATAGLHHPIRSGTAHGFLNLLSAAAFAHAHAAPAAELEGVLGEEDPGAFTISDSGIAVAGRRAGVEEIAAARERLFAGYGSCSWREPVEDLQALGIL
jgi:hypothetical protein